MTKHNYNIKLDIPQDADSARYYIPKGYIVRLEDGVLIIEPEESEDERRIDAICELLENTSAVHPNYSCRKLIIWLKSLRPSWKPSEEHLSALLAVLNDPNNIGSQTCQLALTDLYEQLKKLM